MLVRPDAIASGLIFSRNLLETKDDFSDNKAEIGITQVLKNG